MTCIVSVRAQDHSGIDSPRVISIAGIWHFRADPMGTGLSDKGVPADQPLSHTILLPGSMDQAGYGLHNEERTSLRLSRLFSYTGAAWYEKKITIPADWKKKDIHLFLERAHWETQLWVNGKKAGTRNSLATPHIYDVTDLVQVGKENTIRLRVDNGKIYDIGQPHAISEETQTNWNGIIGKMELRAFDKVHLADVQVYPDVAHKSARVRVTLANPARRPLDGTLSFNARLMTDSSSGSGSHVVRQTQPFSGADSLIAVTVNLSLGDSIVLWDAFHPDLYMLDVQMHTAAFRSQRRVTFGMRDFSTKGTQFLINGRPLFLRADVHCAESPLTGYPAMDRRYWTHVFEVCRQYGLNAVRFHTWCPPEAAFDAADRLGFYLQIENADWRFNIGMDTAANHFLTEEADRILKTYGNHPSFMLFCEGNELVGPGRDSFLVSRIRYWKKEDPRHLYTGSSGYPATPGSDYIDLYGPRAQHWKEGLKGRLNRAPYHTDFDYHEVVSKHDQPVVSHEVGQWCVYPDFDQIAKYTGILKPYNYALFRESLRKHHMLDQARAFVKASGKFQVIQKKEELEALLRTPGLGGYQLLELQDFPGQGTAPVGVVDIFWDPKPYVTAQTFRSFQAAQVLLFRAPSFILTNDQTFHGKAELVNYGAAPMKDVAVHWQLQSVDGDSIYMQGDWPARDIPVGEPYLLDSLALPLDGFNEATRVDLVLSVKGRSLTNRWRLWIYPKSLPDVPGDYKVFHRWSKKLASFLQKGGKALLLADTAELSSNLWPSFSGISWNAVWSGSPPDKLGILCDPKHPALKYFPTAFHSNWQWWDLTRHCKPMNLNALPPDFRPIVQMIPDWNKNNKIGLLLEAKVGKGKLLMSSMDLVHNLDRRPVARQMLYSLKKYISTADFDPEYVLELAQIAHLFKPQK